MEDLIDTLTRGNITEVKVTLASVVVALAFYQVALMAVAYGWVRVPFLARDPAAQAHRAQGDAMVVIAVVVATMCVGVYGFEADETAHVACACALLAVLALKIVVVRWWRSASRLLPILGTAVLVLFTLTWLTSAAGVLADA